MPCDVAVDQPGAWVVGAHGDGDVALVREEDDVTAWGVVEVEVCEACSGSVLMVGYESGILLTFIGVELALVLGQYHDIVTMPVDRMGDYIVIVGLAIISQAHMGIELTRYDGDIGRCRGQHVGFKDHENESRVVWFYRRRTDQYLRVQYSRLEIDTIPSSMW